MLDICEILSEICAIDGVSGDEDRVRKYIQTLVTPYADKIKSDRLGNLMVLKKSGSNLPPRMLAAHMDEAGFIVRGVTEDGYIKFVPVGGVDVRVTIGKHLRINGAKGAVYGVTGICPVHLSSESAKKKAPKFDDLYIDIGASTREEALKCVNIGDYISFTTEPAPFGNGYFKAKAIDDRVGCAVMIKLICECRAPARDTWFVFTTREEIGGAGAKVSSFTISPAEAMVLEGTTAADIPGVSGDKTVCRLDKGVVISYMDKSAIYSPDMFRALCQIAEENRIPYQTKTVIAGGTDAGSIYVSRGGIPCSGLAVPVRYIHSPASVVKISDCEVMYSLARLYIMSK